MEHSRDISSFETTPGTRSGLPPVNAPFLNVDAPRAEPSVPSGQTSFAQHSADSSRAAEDALLADAGRIFEQLRIRLSELDHREKSLLQQARDLEERQSRFTRWVDQTKQDLSSRESRIVQLETAATRRETELDEQSRLIQSERAALDHNRERFATERAEHEQRHLDSERELEQLRRVRLEEISRLEQESAAQIEQKRREFEQFCMTELEEIKQQQSQATRRLKLQEDHLERMRAQVEQQRTALQQETQVSRQQLQERQTILTLRHTQLGRVRTLLDQRQETIRREDLLNRQSHTEHQRQLDAREQDLSTRVNEWKELYSTQKQELDWQRNSQDRQEQQLLLLREKLQQLRQEIQQQHADNLEVRLAIEELKIEQAIERGQTPDLESLNAIRDKLAEHFVATRNQLEELENRLTAEDQELQTRIIEQKRFESQAQEWIKQGMHTWEQQREQLAAERTDLARFRKDWESERTARLRERREAEQIIQNLLEQLEPTEEVPEQLRREAA